jgi:type VI secretion system protein ImpJ
LASGKIDWKLGSTDQIDFLFQQRAEGVRLLPVKQVPRALPVRGNWIYFSISRDNDAWKQVQLTNSLGMRVKEEQIHNINSLQGQRKIIIHADGKLVGLEFAVFAVRVRI